MGPDTREDYERIMREHQIEPGEAPWEPLSGPRGVRARRLEPRRPVTPLEPNRHEATVLIVCIALGCLLLLLGWWLSPVEGLR